MGDLKLHPAPAPRGEIGYAEVTAAQATTNLTSANKVAITGLEITVTVGIEPVLFHLHLPVVANGTSGSGLGAGIWNGATELAEASFTSSGNAIPHSLDVFHRFTTPGSVTVTAYFWGRVGGTATITGNSVVKPFLRAVE